MNRFNSWVKVQITLGAQILVRSTKNTAVIFIALATLILVISSPRDVSAVKAAGPENDWRARTLFYARPESVGGPDPLSPSQIIGAYNLYSATGGAGTTIAIVDAYDDPTITNDLSTFSSYFGLPAATLVEHKMERTISTNSDWSLEISLDVEWAHAIAPQATILLVEAKSDTLADLMAAVSYATSQTNVKAVSTSWGGSEFSTESSYDSYFSTAGITFFASSGDNGSGVIWPSSSPNVVGVGGTTLNLNSNGTVSSETAWSGSGGGVSAYEARPAYQTGYGLTYGGRAVPDVSYDADPSTGVSVYDSIPYQGSSGWWNVGGTSVGAPQWAAIQALGLSANNVNFYVDAASSGYASYFRDITSGSNGYSAGPGYDLVTGLGSPVTTNFTLSTAPDFSLSASPATLNVGNGTTGTSTITVTALNGFTGRVALSATAPASWTASLGPSSILTSGQSTLSVTVPGNASGGAYSVTVVGTNGSLNHTVSVTVQVTSSVHINADGSVTPVGAPIVTSDNVTYSLIGNIGYPTYYGITVQRSNIIIDGNGYGVQGSWTEYGLNLANVNNVTIKNTNVESFDYGIYLDSSKNNSINGNNITADNDYGIYFDDSSNNGINGNNITNNFDGILLSSSSNNSISANNITANDYEGIYLESSNNNSISENNITNSDWGILLEFSSNYNSIRGNTFIDDGLYVSNSYQNSLENNTVNGRPLVYLEDIENYSVGDAGQVVLVNCDGISVENLNLSSVGVGVQLWQTNDTIICGSNIANNFDGILLSSSSNNSISGNNVTANDYEGVYLESSNNNSISENNIANNDYGIYVYVSSSNKIYHNNFINNTNQVFVNVINGQNSWDDGYPSGGNYWSDYDGTDLYSGPYQNVSGSDGIGDTPYVIDANDTDNYPLMGLLSSFDGILAVSNSTISNFQTWAGSYISFNVSGPADTTGFCTVTIPYSALLPQYTIEIDGTPISYTTVYEDETQSVLYFTYQHSTHEVTIIQGPGGDGCGSGATFGRFHFPLCD
jgi:parallel beta-helix repeat protein